MKTKAGMGVCEGAEMNKIEKEEMHTYTHIQTRTQTRTHGGRAKCEKCRAGLGSWLRGSECLLHKHEAEFRFPVPTENPGPAARASSGLGGGGRDRRISGPAGHQPSSSSERGPAWREGGEWQRTPGVLLRPHKGDTHTHTCQPMQKDIFKF